MKAIGSVVSAPFKALGLVSKPPKPLAPVATPTRDDASAGLAADDALRRRRGSASDALLGTSGAEAGATPTKVLFGE